MNSPLSLQALLTAAEPVEPVDVRIKEAALEQFALVGIRRTSADDIAKRAGVNRATLYRRVGGREQITRAALAHEVRRTLARIEARIGAIEDPLERHTRGFVVTVTTLRDHPLLRRLFAVDREEILVWLTLEAGEILRIATAFVTAQTETARTQLGLPGDDRAAFYAATVVRLIHSLVLTPDAPPLLDSEAELRDYAVRYLQPLLTAG
ncbi:TetR/AcrR family transcriptional regulator [Nocardia huaxiensis]|uniref:TetR/AcrR family transcriptional regulator n=1 Tax=Nocardia huaxiensis TaxID=2755382 RepID=A0A7D6VI69_9NOCA|nr:TetR/AcrR family transcriptional regulator [Nocardia huaxiensis]QLY30576.1 TetR/AcrR family transcriptional regulator [Nocardia huaxiensis]UFS95821.1 TetR/AcrR family transcriptional regulator [Nocardia huaxiensis]